MNNDTLQWTGDFGNVPLGLYEIFWKEGGSSLAAIRNLHDGTRWIAPVNWTSKDYPTGKMTDYFASIEKMVLIKSNTSTPEQPKKKRIEVTNASTGDTTMTLYFSGVIPYGKYNQIKTAVERVLNDESNMTIFERILDDFDKNIQEAEERGFNAARERNVIMEKYKTFQDYINHQRDKK